MATTNRNTSEASARRKSSKAPKVVKTRHQYNFSSKTEAELDFAQSELGSETETDAVRDAISLMSWVLALQKDGAKVAIVRGTHVEAIQLFTARHVVGPQSVPGGTAARVAQARG